MTLTFTRSLFTTAAVVAVTSLATAQQVVPDEPTMIPTEPVWIIPQRRPMPMPGQVASIELTGVDVHVTVNGKAASTTMELSVHNSGSTPAEGVLLIPVPDGAVVGAFSYDGEGIEPTAQLLPASEARKIYDDIVRLAKDPAILEFAAWNVVRSSVFPVPPGQTQHVRISWDQVLHGDGDRTDLALPRSEATDEIPWDITITLDNAAAISGIYSPSHDIVVEHDDAAVATVSSVATGTGPFLLSWLRQSDGVAATVFTYPDPTIGGGYFLLLAGMPEVDPNYHAKPREVTIVLDRSGSMAGEKMRQARAAASQIIAALGEDEAFNIIDYASAVESFAPAPVIANATSRQKAEAYLASIRPNGGTNIHDALLEAIRQDTSGDHRSIVLFLTDGLPTVGRTSELAIREMVEAGNKQGRRIFTFGVGSDVNAPLLDRVATITRGSSAYVLPGEDVEVRVATVFKRLAGPVLSDIELITVLPDGTVSTQVVHDLMPMVIPDVFEGEDLLLLGKYKGDEPVTFNLAGTLMGKQHISSFKFDLDATATTRHTFVPRLWAGQRIAWLIDAVRQRGAGSHLRPRRSTQELLRDPEVSELIEEIIRLSLTHGILTEYTAFLATDGTPIVGGVTGGTQFPRGAAAIGGGGGGFAGVALGEAVELESALGLEILFQEDDQGGRKVVVGRGRLEAYKQLCAAEINDKLVQTRAGKGAVAQALTLNEQSKATNLAGINYWYASDFAKQEAHRAVKQCNDKTFIRDTNLWIETSLIDGDSDFIEPDQVVVFGTPQWQEVATELIETGNAAVLALRGPVLLELDGRLILVCRPEDGC
jgi:Ca-activated chloride channel family protein